MISLAREIAKRHWKNHLDRKGGARRPQLSTASSRRDVAGRQARIIWTAWEVPGKQERTNWTTHEAPGRQERSNLTAWEALGT